MKFRHVWSQDVTRDGRRGVQGIYTPSGGLAARTLAVVLQAVSTLGPGVMDDRPKEAGTFSAEHMMLQTFDEQKA